MTKVKGSKAYQWRVVRHRPRLKIWIGLGLVLLVGAAIQAAYVVGQSGAVGGLEESRRELSAVKADLKSTRGAERRLRRQLENAKLGAEVDRQALEEVRQQLLMLKTELASLEEENQFYRNLMAPAGNQRGLNFGTVELAETERQRTFRYKVIMQQLATQHELINGTLSFKIVGRRNGKAATLGLHEVSEEVDSASLKLRFKYFQNIEGQLVLPDGFEPERIELEARSTGKNASVIEKRFGWLVQQGTTSKKL